MGLLSLPEDCAIRILSTLTASKLILLPSTTRTLMSVILLSLLLPLCIALPPRLPKIPGAVDAFVSGEDGYHSYRIPAMIRVQGKLFLFAEGRKLSASDHGWNDIVMKKSADDGASWSSMQVVHGESRPGHLVTIGNPSPIAVHTKPGMIVLVACRNNAEVLQLVSLDDGATWGNATYITAQAKLPGWSWIATGPPSGLQLANGRLLISADHFSNGGKDWGSHSM